jgi:glycosyltransferase involved in cell wall biosynthesis
MATPTVSVVLPTFNRLAYLRAAVDSVLSQSFQDWELIIADDGSDAETKAYLGTFAGMPQVKLLYLPHTGNPPAVRNAALREAKAEYVAFIDSDDIWQPRKLEAQIESLRCRPTRKWSYTRCVMVDGSRNPLTGGRALRYPATDGWILDELLKGEAVVVQSSVLASRELITAAGGYPEDLPICGDYELYVQLALRSEIDLVDEPLVLVRRHTEHYCDDTTALHELRRFLEKVQRSGIAKHMDSTLRTRRALVSAGLARGYAASGNRMRALGTLLSSARYSWHCQEWWYGAMAATARAFAPAWLRSAVRRYRSGLRDRTRQMSNR